MKAYIQQFTQKKFIRNVAVVASGTAMAQIITFLLMPVITRLYGPEAYGVLGTFIAIYLIIGSFTALSYPVAIVLPRKDEEGRQLIRLSWLISFALAGLMLMILLLFGDRLVQTFQLQAMQPFLYFLPLVMVFQGFEDTLNQWMIRKKLFHISARTAVLSSLVVNGSKAGFGWFYPLSATLIFIQTFGFSLRALLLYLMSRKYTNILPETKDPGNAKRLMKKYQDFPYYRAPQEVLNTCSQSLPIFMLAAIAGPAAAGFYTLARTALDMPVILMGKAVMDVFYPKVSEAVHHGDNITRLLQKTMGGLFLLGVLPFGFVMITGPSLFQFVFGAEWGTAGQYAQWIALLSFGTLVTRPMAVTIPAINIQKQYLYYEICSVIARAGALAAGFYYLESALAAVALFSITTIFMYLILTGVVFKKAAGIEKLSR